ncbi:MAG: carboxypeptidase-like regulatory domain-containing protein, partial [Chitinophagaceae bacterium]|nr:carboxypeptidase-like regulatory domain-containing protein [Chitinophagaceae bacterium]
MKLIFTFVVLLLFAFTGFSQNGTSVKGTIQDKSGKPIEAATVTILQAKDSSLYKAAVSDRLGEYLFEKVKPGKYFIKFSSVAHTPFVTAVFEVKESEALNIPATTLAASEKKLKDVIVTAQKPMIEVKADRTVFNVENSIN